MTELFQLQNSQGEIVGINNYIIMSYTPTGLGVDFNNNYTQYENYFIPSKIKTNQGRFKINILFGDIESQSYATFSDFATFLSYQPLTLIYNIDDKTWFRDGILSSLTKTEIGGSTVFQTDKLNESFSLDFINIWYNNKSIEYKTYKIDSSLDYYGKIFNHFITKNNITDDNLIDFAKIDTAKTITNEKNKYCYGYFDRKIDTGE